MCSFIFNSSYSSYYISLKFLFNPVKFTITRFIMKYSVLKYLILMYFEFKIYASIQYFCIDYDKVQINVAISMKIFIYLCKELVFSGIICETKYFDSCGLIKLPKAFFCSIIFYIVINFVETFNYVKKNFGIAK